MALSSRIALMHDGRIVQLATPGTLYRRPASVFAAGFVGDANLLRCRVEERAGRAVAVHAGEVVPGVDAAGRSGEVQVMVRPEDVRVHANGAAPAHGGLRGEVAASTFHGFYWMHRVRSGEDLLAVRETAESPSVAVGDAVVLTIEPDRAVLLDG